MGAQAVTTRVGESSLCAIDSMLRISMAAARRRAAAQTVRGYGTSLPIPTPPAGTPTFMSQGAVFHSRMQSPKYSLSNPKWFGIFFAMNAGVYLGHYFYMRLLMRQNPPNPPRDPENTGAPEKHMHATDDD